MSALKALAFKDKVSDSDINGTISDSHIASASTWNGKADKANITGATKCKITYNGQGIVTSGADLSASDIPNLPASKITSGTFGTDRIADDDKVKDNETLPVNVSGKSSKSDSLDTKYPSLTDFDALVPERDDVVQYSINGNYTNGPSGVASIGYWGILQVFWRNRYPYQLFLNSTSMWVRYSTTQTGGSWTDWSTWTLVNAVADTTTLKSNTATLYISGYHNNMPVYHVKDIKNGCVNYVHVKDTSSSSCNLTIEAPALAAGEEYDYVVVFDTFTNNNLVGNIDVENCKTTGHFENGVFVHDTMTISSVTPSQVPMIVVTGNVARPQWYDRT